MLYKKILCVLRVGAHSSSNTKNSNCFSYIKRSFFLRTLLDSRFQTVSNNTIFNYTITFKLLHQYGNMLRCYVARCKINVYGSKYLRSKSHRLEISDIKIISTYESKYWICRAIAPQVQRIKMPWKYTVRLSEFLNDILASMFSHGNTRILS